MAENSRALDSRAATARQVIGGNSDSLLDIDVSGLPSDMEATWIRESTTGDYDHANIRAAQMRRGYVPVTTEMLPHMNPAPLPGQPADSSGLIREGGLLLMMRPKKRTAEDRDKQIQDDEAAKNAASRIPELSTGANRGADGDNFIEHRQVSERVNKGGGAGRFKE